MPLAVAAAETNNQLEEGEEEGEEEDLEQVGGGLEKMEILEYLEDQEKMGGSGYP